MDAWIPHKGDRFDAFQKRKDISDKHNPQTCTMKYDVYIDAIDNAGNQRTLRFSDWRFERAKR